MVIVGTGGIVRGGRFIFVKKGSPISSARELKGKTVGVMAIASTAVAHVRIVLSRKYGLNTGLKGGDIKWAQIPLPMLPTVLDRGDIDAAFLFHTPSFKAMKAQQFSIIGDVVKEYNELFGLNPLVSLFVSYADKVKRNPERFREALRLIRASVRYAKEHREEVYAQVARKSRLPVNTLKTLAGEWYEVNITLEEGDLKAIKNMWEVGKETGVIKDYPSLNEVIWQ
jgi:NitT/TauT family transport system substrate-binding protein